MRNHVVEKALCYINSKSDDEIQAWKNVLLEDGSKHSQELLVIMHNVCCGIWEDDMHILMLAYVMREGEE